MTNHKNSTRTTTRTRTRTRTRAERAEPTPQEKRLHTTKRLGPDGGRYVSVLPKSVHDERQQSAICGFYASPLLLKYVSNSPKPRGLLGVRVQPTPVPDEVLQEGVLLAAVTLAGHLFGFLLEQLLLLRDLRGCFFSDLRQRNRVSGRKHRSSISISISISSPVVATATASPAGRGTSRQHQQPVAGRKRSSSSTNQKRGVGGSGNDDSECLMEVVAEKTTNPLRSTRRCHSGL